MTAQSESEPTDHVESMAQYLAMTAGQKWDALADAERDQHRKRARQISAEKARRATDGNR